MSNHTGNSIASNNIAAVLRNAGITALIARSAARQLDMQHYQPSQIRTAVRTRGIAEVMSWVDVSNVEIVR